MAREDDRDPGHAIDSWPRRLALSAIQAGEVSHRTVSSACASDYMAYCSQHPSAGPGVRRCIFGASMATGCRRPA